VRAAVRSFTLNLCAVDSPALQSYLAEGPAAGFFGVLGSLLTESCQVRGACREARTTGEGLEQSSLMPQVECGGSIGGCLTATRSQVSDRTDFRTRHVP